MMSSALSLATAPTHALRVLVVDDADMIRDIAAAFISSAGHEIVCVGSGADAVKAVMTTDYDVVMMPGMDGFEATRRIRALEAPRGQVPIVAMTLKSFSEQAETYLSVGMDGHVIKPFTRDSLLKALMRGVVEGQLVPASFFVTSVITGRQMS
jgi:CheY-like chemotaxis protein